MYFEIFHVTNMKNVYIYFKWIHKVKAKGQHAIQRNCILKKLQSDKVNSILIKKMSVWLFHI